MSGQNHSNGQSRLQIGDGAIRAETGRQDVETAKGQEGDAGVRSRVIERVALVRFEGHEFLFGEGMVRQITAELNQLVAIGGHTRLVLNFVGVSYVSGAMLDELVALNEKLEWRGGGLSLCGLTPLLRELLRVANLDGVFDICAREAEALGLLG